MATSLARSRRSVDDVPCASVGMRTVPSTAQAAQERAREREIRDLASAVARVRSACKSQLDRVRAHPPPANEAMETARSLLVVRAQLQFDLFLLWLWRNDLAIDAPASVPEPCIKHTCTCCRCV